MGNVSEIPGGSGERFDLNNLRRVRKLLVESLSGNQKKDLQQYEQEQLAIQRCNQVQREAFMKGLYHV